MASTPKQSKSNANKLQPKSQLSYFNPRIQNQIQLTTIKLCSMEFPSNIIYNILLRQPVKVLLRFRCVSKAWSNIIDSHSFAHAHVIAATEESHHLPLNLSANRDGVFPYIYDGHALKQSEHALFPYIYDDNNALKPGEYPTNLDFSNERDTPIYFVAYGFICFGESSCHVKDHVHLWNPLRREVLRLPKLGYYCDYQHDYYDAYRGLRGHFGMGYDSATGTYKIVQSYPVIELSDYKIAVYTLGKDDSWRIISSSLALRPDVSYEFGVSAYGDMHWISFDQNNIRTCIFSFDFNKEEFKKIDLPVDCDMEPRSPSLINLRGNLALVTFPTDDYDGDTEYIWIEIWVLKDHYERNEWSKAYKISTDQDGDRIEEEDFFQYVCSIVVAGRWMVLDTFRHDNKFVLDLESDDCHLRICPVPKNFDHHDTIRFTGSVLSFKNLK